MSVHSVLRHTVKWCTILSYWYEFEIRNVYGFGNILEFWKFLFQWTTNSLEQIFLMEYQWIRIFFLAVIISKHIALYILFSPYENIFCCVESFSKSDHALFNSINTIFAIVSLSVPACCIHNERIWNNYLRSNLSEFPV